MSGGRIALWSGPRNISTAMMRSWGSRADTVVTDEPLYGPYLAASGANHPGRDEVIAAQGADWRPIVARLTGDVPEGKTLWYQKHMTHHLLPAMDREWIHELGNGFLIRDPGEVIRSYVKVVATPTPEDLGYPQQVEIFEAVRRRTGRVPPVLDARDVLEDPRRLLSLLCAALGVGFDEAMLSWTPGPRTTDGVWAPHWYASVERSRGFAPYRPPQEPLPRRFAELDAACREHYEPLYRHRLGT